VVRGLTGGNALARASAQLSLVRPRQLDTADRGSDHLSGAAPAVAKGAWAAGTVMVVGAAYLLLFTEVWMSLTRWVSDDLWPAFRHR
jgi:hypothetical protein